jgi:hypothetical protein
MAVSPTSSKLFSIIFLIFRHSLFSVVNISYIIIECSFQVQYSDSASFLSVRIIDRSP